MQCASCDQDEFTETVLPLTLNKPIVHDEQRGAERAGCGGVRTQARNTQDIAMGGRGVVQLRGQRCVRARAIAQRAYSRGVDARQQPDGPLPAAQPAPARRTRLPACLPDERAHPACARRPPALLCARTQLPHLSHSLACLHRGSAALILSEEHCTALFTFTLSTTATAARRRDGDGRRRRRAIDERGRRERRGRRGGRGRRQRAAEEFEEEAQQEPRRAQRDQPGRAQEGGGGQAERVRSAEVRMTPC